MVLPAAGVGCSRGGGKVPKNIVFMVSDGMSPGVLPLAEIFSKAVRQRGTVWAALLRDSATPNGMFDQASLNSCVTDSAAASSAWGSGVRICNGAINTLPNGEPVGVIDVPGHKDFIRNMLSGVGGIDAALLVIAADGGVMPQTREHLAILDLLRVQAGVIALTKSDLVDDPEWIDLVSADVMDVVEGTCMEDAAIVPVSAHSGAGLDQLVAELEHVLEQTPARAIR